jgi:hypothetical protein
MHLSFMLILHQNNRYIVLLKIFNFFSKFILKFLRVTTEDPARGFQPDSGRVSLFYLYFFKCILID